MAKKYWRAISLAACLNLLLLTGVAYADEVAIVTGEHWVKSSDELKKAYLIGVERAADRASLPGEQPSDRRAEPRAAVGQGSQGTDARQRT